MSKKSCWTLVKMELESYFPPRFSPMRGSVSVLSSLPRVFSIGIKNFMVVIKPALSSFSDCSLDFSVLVVHTTVRRGRGVFSRLDPWGFRWRYWICSPRSPSTLSLRMVIMAHIHFLAWHSRRICHFPQVDAVLLKISSAMLSNTFVLPTLILNPTSLLRSLSSCNISLTSGTLFAKTTTPSVNHK